ncbi:MAG: sporulation integral membrane protein YtvI [Longicatena sp.]
MPIDKQKNFIIHFLYCALWIFIIYFFVYKVFTYIYPFFFGFLIAFLLRPISSRMASHHQKASALCIITIFYTMIAFLIGYILLQSYAYMNKAMLQLPLYYHTYIEPYLQISFGKVESVINFVNIDTSQLITTFLQSLQSSLSNFIASFSTSMIQSLTSFITTLPTLFLSFFITVLSSFFITIDYPSITCTILNLFPRQVRDNILSTKNFLKETLLKLTIAYGKLMLLTFLELAIGFYILGIDHILLIALGIALFDIIPVLGVGGILLPWIVFTYVNSQLKRCIGLCILYLVITIIRNIAEPRIVGKQIGLHPLIMLACMYVGAKLFGFLGIFMLPICLLVAQHLYQKDPNNMALH